MTVMSFPKNVRARDLSPDETLKMIEHYIRNPPDHSVVLTITPEIAIIILDKYGSGNRPKKPTATAKYARAMKSDGWHLNGATIVFSEKNLLRDGQHRLHACINSGSSFTTHVVFGIEDAAFASMDRNKLRTVGDVLSIAGHRNTTVLHAAVRWLWLLQNGTVKQRKGIEPDEALRLLEEHPGLADFVQQAMRIGKRTEQPAGLVTAMLYQFHRAHERRCADFGSDWETGAWGGRGKAIGKMQAEIASIRSASSGRIHDVVRAAFIVIAWRLYLKGAAGTRADFRFDPSEKGPAFPSIFG